MDSFTKEATKKKWGVGSVCVWQVELERNTYTYQEESDAVIITASLSFVAGRHWFALDYSEQLLRAAGRPPSNFFATKHIERRGL